MGEAPDPELTSRMQKPCTKSRHPNVHICKKQPKTKFARKIHKKMKHLLKRLQKKEINRKKRREGGPERKKRTEGGHWRKNRTKNRYWKRKKGLKPKSLSRRKIRVVNV